MAQSTRTVSRRAISAEIRRNRNAMKREIQRSRNGVSDRGLRKLAEELGAQYASVI